MHETGTLVNNTNAFNNAQINYISYPQLMQLKYKRNLFTINQGEDPFEAKSKIK